MSRRIVITGGNGFVGRILVRGLRERGYEVDVLDRWDGWAVIALHGRYLGTSTTPWGRAIAAVLNRALFSTQSALRGTGVLRPTGQDILAARAALVDLFRGRDAIVHLAAISGANYPGASADDYRRVNLDGSINAFEAARAAGVPRFVFGSSVGVYGFSGGIARGTRIDQFPILETNHRPDRPGENTTYALTKIAVEDYLEKATPDSPTKAVALRLGAPGFRISLPPYLGMATSIENLVEGFDAALRSGWDFDFEPFNLMDAHRDLRRSVDVHAVIRERWPDVPSRLAGDEMAFSTAKIAGRLGYRAARNGTYVAARIANLK